MKGQGPYAEMIRKRVEAASRKHGLHRRQWSLDVSRFAVPRDPDRQMELFC
jgi:hypothetical protein